MGATSFKALVLDFGGPVLRTPFELLRAGEARTGLAPGTLGWTGPFDPSADPPWQRMTAGETTERAYWQQRAEEFGALTGREASFPGLMAELFAGDEAELVRPQARELVRDAHAAGLPVAVCTNDLLDFHGAAWVERISVLYEVDLVVDGSVEGVLKPDPRMYALVTDRLGVAAADCLFVDDQPGNVAGAREAGMGTVWFDVTDPDGSYCRCRTVLGLDH